MKLNFFKDVMCPPNPFYFLFMSLIKYKLDSMLNIYQITPHSNKPFVFGVLKKGFFVGDNEEHFVTKVREGARLGSGRLIKAQVCQEDLRRQQGDSG